MKTKTLKKNKVNVVTLGCSKNIFDSEEMMAQLKANKYDVVHESDDGDANTLHVIKKGGRREPLDKKKVSKHLNKNLLSSNFTYHLRLINSSLSSVF